MRSFTADTVSLLPLPPRPRLSRRDLPADLVAAATVCFLTVPQGLAYATIAGLPPATGLYAAAVPAIVGSLFRSSEHVISGPTNALSLLVGAAVATGLGGDPAGVALTLALMVGVMQVAAGVLRLGSVVDYISGPVVLGYITGAGVLIGVGQLHNITATTPASGSMLTVVAGWIATIPDASMPAVMVTAATVGTVVGLRRVSHRWGRRIPASIVAMSAALLTNLVLDLESRGLPVLSDLQPIPLGMPAPAIPALDDLTTLLPVAVACTVLSLVESSAVARSIGTRTGQRIEASTEFVGQGLSNVAAGLFGGYPVSGSLARSTLNERAGARTRVSGIVAGLLMLGVLLVAGPLLDHTPIASLAGLLLVVAWDLVDGPRLLQTMRGSWEDGLALGVTMLGTWTLRLDTAIYVGVGVSVITFLRKARMLVMREMVLDTDGRWQDRRPGRTDIEGRLPGIRVLQAEGPLFFGSAGELRSWLDEAWRDPEVRVVILRLKRAQGMDVTVANALAEVARLAEAEGRRLLLVGMHPTMRRVLERSGAARAFDPSYLIDAHPQRFAAVEAACQRARAFVERGADGLVASATDAAAADAEI